MSKYPNKEEMSIIDQTMEETGISGPAARAACVEAFVAGDIGSLDELGSYLVVQQVRQPKVFKSGGIPDSDNVSDADVQAIRKRSTNPFSRDAWNVTEQGRLLRAIGQEKCAALARAAGVTIGATRPAA